MEREEVDAHVERLKNAMKDPERVEDPLKNHEGMLYALSSTPSGRKFLASSVLPKYLDALEHSFVKSSPTMQRNLLNAFSSILDERVVATLSELPEDHPIHQFIIKAIKRRNTNALSIAAAALMDMPTVLDSEGYYAAHPHTLQYLDYFAATHPKIGRHRLGDAARSILKLALHSRVSENGPVSLRIALTDAMRQWAQKGLVSFRGFRSFLEFKDVLRELAEKKGWKKKDFDLFSERFYSRILDRDAANHVASSLLGSSISGIRQLPPEGSRNLLHTIREFPELLHAVGVVATLPREDLHPVHIQSLSGLNELFLHYVLGQHREYLDKQFRRWAGEAALHVFGKRLSELPPEQRVTATEYLQRVWNAMNTPVSFSGGTMLFGKKHTEDMLRSLYTEISCFTPYKASGNVPEAMSVVFLPHTRDSEGDTVPIIPYFAVVKRGDSIRGRVLVHHDYKNGRLVLGSYGGSVSAEDVLPAVQKYAKQVNAAVREINKEFSKKLDFGTFSPISPIREIIVGDESEDWKTHIIYPGELLPFYGDYLDKVSHGREVYSVARGKKILVE